MQNFRKGLEPLQTSSEADTLPKDYYAHFSILLLKNMKETKHLPAARDNQAGPQPLEAVFWEGPLLDPSMSKVPVPLSWVERRSHNT